MMEVPPCGSGAGPPLRRPQLSQPTTTHCQIGALHLSYWQEMGLSYMLDETHHYWTLFQNST